MKGNEYNEYKGTGAIQKVEVCLGHHQKRKLFEMKGKEQFFKSTGAVQKSGVGLDHHETILIKMTGNKNVGKSTGGVQKVEVEVGLDHH